MTEAGSEEVGEPVAFVSYSGWNHATNPHLIVGGARRGYYVDSAPAGYFKGEMREATLFKGQLTKEALLADVKTFSPGVHPVDEFATFHWNLDETGATPVAADATGNGFAGTTAGNVVGGLAAPVGTCYGGFTNPYYNIYTTLTNEVEKLDVANYSRSEIALWVKRPEGSDGKEACLVGGMAKRNEPKANQPWRVFVTNGAVGVSMYSTWHGVKVRSVGEPYDWGKSWNLVVVRIESLYLPVEFNQQGEALGENRMCHRIRVYAAPAAKAGEEGVFTLLAEAALQQKENDTNFAGSCYDIVFGAAPAGWYDIHPDSFLGAKGRIGEVAMIADGWFDMGYLKSRLSRYWKPAEGCVFIVR